MYLLLFDSVMCTRAGILWNVEMDIKYDGWSVLLVKPISALTLKSVAG